MAESDNKVAHPAAEAPAASAAAAGTDGARSVTSTVLLKGCKGEWYEVGLLIPHEPLRIHLNAAMHLLQPATFSSEKYPWKVTNFFKWWDGYFFKFLDGHHHNEEKIFFPWVNTRAKLPEQLVHEHGEMLMMMKGIHVMKQEFNDVKTSEQHAAFDEKLRTNVKTLADHLFTHLATEERVMPPMLKEHFQEKEQKATVDKIIKNQGLGGAKVELPFIYHGMLRWAGEEWAAKFLGNIPGPIRYMLKNYWITDYYANNWGMLHSLSKDVKPADPKSHGLFFKKWDYAAELV